MNRLIVVFFLYNALLSVAQAQSDPIEIPLWENGAPGFENRKDEPIQAKDWWVKNIHNPTITLYKPEVGNTNGTAVIIFPGGGHRNLVFNAEGKDPALYLTSLGITAFALKYRLAREENSPYDLEIHPRQDAYRAIRYVRANAKQWNLDPARIGVMGFSAGGEVAAMVAYATGDADLNIKDEVDRQNGKPNFQILIYPGPGFIPESIDNTAPPAFILAAIDDQCCSAPSLKLLNMYHKAGVPAEAHIYSKGGHAFNMGYRSNLTTLSSWPDRLEDWFKDNKLINN